MHRRRFIQYGVGLGLLGGFAYGYQRGFRYPLLSLESKEIADKVELVNSVYKMTDCFIPDQSPVATVLQAANIDRSLPFLRAYAPEPSLTIEGDEDVHFVLNNVPERVVLSVAIDKQRFVTETKNGINRIVYIKKQALPLQLNWHWPDQEPFDFASIGDSGGQRELDWCIQRASQVGADFLLHLGDFNYGDTDYDNAVDLFYKASLPCYVSIGNHDFRNNDGSYINRFIQQIGPLNHAFSLLGTRFINLDTAASFFPVKGGQRGTFVGELLQDEAAYNDSVVLTHRPFYDPDEERHHDIGNKGETDWLIQLFHQVKASTCLAGHIHQFYDLEREGLRLVIAGQGTGHQDIIHDNNKVSKLVMGRVDPLKPVDYRFAELLMPIQYHCHPRVSGWKEANPELERVRQTIASCQESV